MEKNTIEQNFSLPTTESKIGSHRRIIIAISVGLFLFSLTKQCYCTTNQCGDAIMAFLVGWLGLVFGGAALTWLANPLIIFSWILTKKKSKHSFIVSVLGSIICFSFLLFDTFIDDEAGHYNKIISYQAGYWLWTFSSVTMALGNIYLRLAKSTADKNAS